MKKQMISIVVAVAMLLTTAGVVTAAPAAAASTPYMMGYSGLYEPQNPHYVYEKVGKYYIWVQGRWGENKAGDSLWITELKCKTAPKKKAKVLKSIKSADFDKQIEDVIVTNGNTIYYAVSNGAEGRAKNATVYRTTVKGKSHKKIKTIKHFSNLAGCYNNRLYYNIFRKGKEDNCLIDLYSYQLKKKSTRQEKKQFTADSSYGKYITGSSAKAEKSWRSDKNYAQALYNVQTRKSKTLPKSYQTVVYGQKIYYGVYANKGKKITIKNCNLQGKKKKTTKTISSKDSVGVAYMGKRLLYVECVSEGMSTVKKLSYKTKKLAKVKKYCIYDQ